MKRWLVAWLIALAALQPLGGAAAADQVVAPPTAPRQVLLLLRLPPEHYRPESGYSGGRPSSGTVSTKQSTPSSGRAQSVTRVSPCSRASSAATRRRAPCAAPPP